MKSAFNDFFENYSDMMKGYYELISKINTSPLIETFNKIQESIKPISFKINNYYNSQAFKVMTDYMSSASKEITNIAKLNNDIINETIKKSFNNINLNYLLNSYTDALKDINFNNISLNLDGSIQYEDEKIEIEEESVNEALNILKDIKEDIRDIKKDTSDIKNSLPLKRTLILAVILFIIGGIAEGFLNKCGESIFELIPSAYNSFIEDNNYQDEDSSRIEFFDKFRIVNASELNVREMPDSASNLIGRLYLNQCVEVIEKTKYWTKIQYTNKEKEITIIGWVYSRYLLTFDEQTSTLMVQE